MYIFILIQLLILSQLVRCVGVTELVKSKFNVDSRPLPAESAKQTELNMFSVASKVMQYNKLGSKAGRLAVDEVRLHHIAPDPTPKEYNKPGLASESTTPGVVVDFELISSKPFVQNFLVFKQLQHIQEVDTNPPLVTSFKNYDDSLNTIHNLKSFTSKIIQENEEEKDFDDYSFKRFGTKKKPKPMAKTHIDNKEFMDYLVRHEGFREQDILFLEDAQLDHGLEEIEEELNKIKDLQREREKTIDIVGDSLATTNQIPRILSFISIVLTLLS